MADKPIRVGLLVDVQYPPHLKPVPAGRIVTDYPVAALAGDVRQGWIMRIETVADERAFRAQVKAAADEEAQ